MLVPRNAGTRGDPPDRPRPWFVSLVPQPGYKSLRWRLTWTITLSGQSLMCLWFFSKRERERERKILQRFPRKRENVFQDGIYGFRYVHGLKLAGWRMFCMNWSKIVEFWFDHLNIILFVKCNTYYKCNVVSFYKIIWQHASISTGIEVCDNYFSNTGKINIFVIFHNEICRQSIANNICFQSFTRQLCVRCTFSKM